MKLISAALFAAVVLVAFRTSAEEGSAQQHAMPAADEPHVPGLGEIMALQQMRHIKLWFAGSAANWPLADYEIGELKEGFDAVNRQLGGDTVEKAVGAPIAALERVIETKDRAAFAGAFDKLTAGCNGCHRLLEREFIVVQRPSLQPYSDESFAPQK